MNPTEFVNKVKSLFNEETNSTQSVDAFAEYVLADGTKISCDKLEIGGKVVLADGTPAPIGEHILADGTSLQVDENGIIIELESPKEDTMPEEEMKKEEEKVSEMEAKLQSLEEKIAMAETELKRVEELASAKFSKFQTAIQDLASAIEGIANAPTANPIEAPKDKFQLVESKESKINKYLNFTKSINN